MAELRKSTDGELRRIKPIILAMSAVNRWVFRASGGRLGSRFLRGAPVGLLTTVGRKSGQRHTTPLIYLDDGERVVLVASQGGSTKHPIWYLNLTANPAVSFQKPRAADRPMRARTASPTEKKDYWPRLVAIYRDYDDYQKRTDRDIPVVVLEAV